MDVPADAPESCPVCEAAYDSVSVHDAGLMVNLLDNDRYRRVCFEPVAASDPTTAGGPDRVEGDAAGGAPDPRALVRFYHHTHDQTAGRTVGETD
jgi:hypothetical protein